MVERNRRFRSILVSDVLYRNLSAYEAYMQSEFGLDARIAWNRRASQNYWIVCGWSLARGI